MINTKQVAGRRSVRYTSLDDVVKEARQFANSDVRELGNWSQGQIYEHLARSLNGSIDGIELFFSAPVRWIMSLLMKKKFLEREIPAGFASIEEFVPAATTPAEGIASLEKAVARQAAEPHRVIHPGLGNIGREGWAKFHLRHAELHMSFIVPQDSSS